MKVVKGNVGIRELNERHESDIKVIFSELQYGLIKVKVPSWSGTDDLILLSIDRLHAEIYELNSKDDCNY